MKLMIDSVMIFLVLTNLFFLASSWLPTCIILIAAQGALLGLLPILIHWHALKMPMIGLAILAFSLKGVIFPWLIMRSVGHSHERRESKPFIGHTPSLLIGLGLIAMATYLSSQWQLIGGGIPQRLMIIAAFTMILTGTLAIIGRRKAVSQVLGYLMLENGVYSFGLVMLKATPFLVEFAILMDAFVAVLVMTLAIHEIQRVFDGTDVDRLSLLKG